MENIVRIAKKGEDKRFLNYWVTLSGKERLKNLENLRQEVIKNKYDTEPGFQRVYRIVKTEPSVVS